MITKKKVLIIKLGHSETLDPIISKECSLGDVVRTTVILNYFRDNDIVSWLVDEKALPLLEGNPYIDRLLEWNWETSLLLLREKFDVVVNLEKSPAVCALSDNIEAWQKYGFRLSEWHGKAEAHYKTEKVLELATNPIKRDQNKKYWQEHLAKAIDKRWSIKDKYMMQIPTGDTTYDVGLNWRVGSKWPEKAWEYEKWLALEEELKNNGLTVSVQPNLSIGAYTNWINSCRSIISCDSLGMHLGIAYSKRTLGLFGPTNAQEVYFYNKGAAIEASDGLMSSITVEQVVNKLMEVIDDSTNKDMDTSS